MSDPTLAERIAALRRDARAAETRERANAAWPTSLPGIAQF